MLLNIFIPFFSSSSSSSSSSFLVLALAFFLTSNFNCMKIEGY